MLPTSDDGAVYIDSDIVSPGWDESGADPDGDNLLSTDEDFGALLLQRYDNVLENDSPFFKIAGADWDLPSRRPSPHAGQQPSARRHGARTDEQDPAVLNLEKAVGKLRLGGAAGGGGSKGAAAEAGASGGRGGKRTSGGEACACAVMISLLSSPCLCPSSLSSRLTLPAPLQFQLPLVVALFARVFRLLLPILVPSFYPCPCPWVCVCRMPSSSFLVQPVICTGSRRCLMVLGVGTHAR